MWAWDMSVRHTLRAAFDADAELKFDSKTFSQKTNEEQKRHRIKIRTRDVNELSGFFSRKKVKEWSWKAVKEKVLVQFE